VEAPPPDVKQDPNNCPLTPGQLRVFNFLREGAPVKKKGKPSAKKLALIRAHQDQVDNFTKHLSSEAKQWIKRQQKKAAGGKESETASSAAKPLPLMRARSMSMKVLFNVLPLGFAIDESEEEVGEAKNASKQEGMVTSSGASSATAGESDLKSDNGIYRDKRSRSLMTRVVSAF